MANRGYGVSSRRTPRQGNRNYASPKEEEYFGIDPQIMFRVEGALFGLPRSQLMASKVFRGMLFDIDENPGSPKKGTRDNPIKVERFSNVSLEQVKAFYKVMNYRGFDAELTLSVEQWSQALYTAITWGFENIRTFSIKHLDALLDDPLQRITFADAYDVKEWLHPAYAKLCARVTSLTLEEGRVLGLERFTILCRIREDGLKNGGCGVVADPNRDYGYGYGQTPPDPYAGYSYGQPNLPWSTSQSNSYGDSQVSTHVVQSCQRNCCKTPFELDHREQAFLAFIAKEVDL